MLRHSLWGEVTASQRDYNRLSIDAPTTPSSFCCMSDVTRILSQIESGDPAAAETLLPLVYEELRRLAAARLAAEPSGNTLQPTALVHEAYLRLVGTASGDQWDHR